MFFTTGKSAKKLVSDNTLDMIQDRLKPHLRAGRYAQAVSSGVMDMGEALAGRLAAPNPWLFFLLIVACIVVWLFLSSWWENRRRAQYASCRRMLSRLEADVARARAAQYRATSCPICMEDFLPDPSAAAAAEADPSGAGTSSSAAAAAASEHPDGPPPGSSNCGPPEVRLIMAGRSGTCA